MKENEKAAKQCVRDYFTEDKTVMIDESIMRIKGGIFYIYDLIYFGNKIIISEETLNKIKSYRNKITVKVLASNCSYLLDSIKSDQNGNYNIVDISQYGNTSIERVVHYLKENSEIIYLLESKKFHARLKRAGIVHQLKLLDIKTKISALCKSKVVKFETVGMIKHEEGKMFITKHSNETIVRVYQSSGKEKQGDNIEIAVNDIILIRSEKNTKYCFNLYWIISKHCKHQAIRIIWTDIEKGAKSNFYIDRLEEKYRNIIKENIL